MPSDPRLEADCSRCVALCCVATAFAASADFGIDKPAGTPCPNLQADDRCGIHDRLRSSGFPGCAAYDCFGAGQHVTQVTFQGRHWRSGTGTAGPMFAAFDVVRRLHELLWYVTEALELEVGGSLRTGLQGALEETWLMTSLPADDLLALDVDEHRRQVNALLVEVSELLRAGTSRPDYRGADLVGADLRRVDLVGGNLRGALLVGADLRGTDLRLADVTGADVRGADLRGADLTGTLFVTRSQLGSARGDASTRLGADAVRPTHWP